MGQDVERDKARRVAWGARLTASMQATLQRGEVEPAGAADHELAIQHDTVV